MLAWEAFGAVQSALHDLKDQFEEIRPKVIHLRPHRAEDRFKLLRAIRSRQPYLAEKKLRCGLYRTPEERARVRPIGQVLGRCRDSLDQAQRSPCAEHDAKRDIEATWGAGIESVRLTTNFWNTEFKIL